uniref:Gustatory receptor n=1 Tax=Acrobeloides nanus TaxID=290746 RepID=A0A914DDX1_9BILA
MDSNSNYAIFCRSFTTFIATLHVCLSPVLHLSYGYAPVIFACFMSVVVPHLLLTIRVRKLIEKENLQVNNRILKFLTRNRLITWNDIQFSTDIFLASINLFAVYANIAVRVRTGGSYIYYLVPSSLSFLLFLSFLMDASFVFHSMKYTSKPSTISVKTRIDKFMNFLAERLVLVQFPMLILLIIWHNAKLTGDGHYLYDISLLAANFIQYPLIFMMIVFIHGRTVRWAQSRLSKCGMHVYGIQYTMLLIISGLSLSSLVLNLELLHQKFYGVVYFVAPYLTFIVSMTQAFALAGHDAWKNYSYPNEEKNLVKANLAENSDGQVTIRTINGKNSDEREDRVEGMQER